ncbi:MAG TPA: hypothetical protein VFM74_04420 [Candidatus Limnocylindria bacterium]|jgi:hypothetical protein|nr:hypothetical protein [Candidatus Limnocylindria bacterium]
MEPTVSVILVAVRANEAAGRDISASVVVLYTGLAAQVATLPLIRRASLE